MDYLVLSDSHGRTEMIDRAMEVQLRAPDAVLFLGDGMRDLRVLEYQDICVRCVRGNCDFYTQFEGQSAPEHALLEVGAYRILMMHGHTHGVKGGMERAVAFAAQAEADVLLYGHTHAARQQWLDAGERFGGQELKKPLLVCNPGALQDGSFGTLHVSNQGILFGFGSLRA
ncbi:MAG: YfcE family phosphodiesterase [Clostridia bacterium]|nr:YfcE family phosphodiesterase [Clostridia bacterium]MBQ5792384.1 YfcE family phosphodiesterase [Clostridia bacterium]